MKRILASIALLFAMLVPLSFFSASPANSVAGCMGKVVLKADTWSQDGYYVWPTSTGGKTLWVRMTATAAYWYCPNGTGYDLIKVKWTDFCYSHREGDGAINFDGVKFNPYYASDSQSTNPPQTKVEDDGTVQNCKKQDIAADDEVWMRMGHSPYWSVSAWIVTIGTPDNHFDFKYDGETYKYFHPSSDVNIGDWHYKSTVR